MSKYTTEVRFICEQLAGLEHSVGYDSVEDTISKAREKIFDFDYPLFDDSYKPVIETKILKHYYTREIGLETYGLWKLKLNTKLNEIMPYYNELYKSSLYEFNPFWDVNKTVEHSGTDTGDKDVVTDFDGNKIVNSTENEEKNKDYSEDNTNVGSYETDVTHSETRHNEHEDDEWNLFSDTPQGGITGIENAYDGVADNAYLTDARNIKQEGSADDTINYVDNTDNSHTDTDQKTGQVGEENERVKYIGESVDNLESKNEVFTNTKDYVQHIYGKQGHGSYSKLLKEFRETFLNIDMMVIDELKNLFFLLW